VFLTLLEDLGLQCYIIWPTFTQKVVQFLAFIFRHEQNVTSCVSVCGGSKNLVKSHASVIHIGRERRGPGVGLVRVIKQRKWVSVSEDDAQVYSLSCR
jgi:hypothetical protein